MFAILGTQVGSSVTLAKLFANFPVRRQQLQNSVKKEFAKAEQLLTAYALVCTGVRYRNVPVNNSFILIVIDKS